MINNLKDFIQHCGRCYFPETLEEHQADLNYATGESVTISEDKTGITYTQINKYKTPEIESETILYPFTVEEWVIWSYEAIIYFNYFR